MMVNLWTILLIAATCIGVSWNSAHAAASAECPQDLSPMPEALHALVSQAEKTGGDDDVAGAAAMLTGYLDAHPGETHPYPYYDAGYFLHQDGKRDAAVDYLRKAVKLNPCFHEAWQLLASLYQEAGETEAAAEVLEKAAAITKEPGTWYQTAVLWLDAERPKKALAALSKLHRTGARQADWYVAEARAHQELKAYARAAEAMASAYALSKDPDRLYQCAVFWLEAEKPVNALPLLKKLTDAGTPESHWLVALSNTLKALKKKEETAEAMERAAGLSRDPNLLFHAAWLWLDADHPKKARGLLEKLAQRKDPQVEWLLALANAYMILDQTRSAALTMDRVAQMEPKSEYLYNAGVLWLHAERPQKALHTLLELCKRSPAKAEWFVALAHAWLGQKEVVHAATAMERAAALSGNSEHAYQAGLMWLQAKQADAALRRLLPLGRQSSPRAEWLAALSNAWILKESYGNAAEAMEKAAQISGKSDHAFRAARLWLVADHPGRGRPLLEALVKLPSPCGEWYIALCNCCLMLGEPQQAAEAMEKGAEITRKGEDTYRAGMLWLQAGNSRKGISLLEICAAREPVEQKWLVDLAQAMVDADRERNALAVMERTVLTDPKATPTTRYQGALLWLHLKRPRKALPVLKVLCASRSPALNWIVSLVKTHVELEQMREAETALKRLIDLYPEDLAAWQLAVWVGLQQSDYAKAAAAMAVAVRLGPPDPDLLTELADFYHLAGASVKAAEALQKSWKGHPTPKDWDRLVNVYLNGHRYEPALACARSAAGAQATAQRWKTVGAIAFRLRRFEESYNAYQHSADLSPDADVRLKAAYAALKMDRLDDAARLSREAMHRAGKNSRTAYEAHRNLAFIKKMLAMQEKGE